MSVDQVIKRDGAIVPMDRKRIENAIFAAARASGNGETRPWAETMSWAVTGLLNERWENISAPPHVEDVQDVVEEVLIKSGNPVIAKAYILYREQRAAARSTKRILLDSEKLVEDYLQVSDWRVSENSNMNYSLQGLNFYLASSIAAQYWLQRIYPPEVQRAHIEGDLHLHDLGMLSVYCCGWDLQDLLMKGFGGVLAKTESLPPKHLRTALGQLANFFYTLQGESAGAVAVSNFDTLLAPFIHFDKLDYAGIKQAVQEFVFNLNVPTRVGFQTPFTNITMDLTPPSTLRDQAVIIGGEYVDATYGEFGHEMNLLNRAFAEVMLEGDAKGRVFTFPIPTYSITPDFDWGASELEPIWAMTARYGIPYFANFVNSDMKPEDTRSMCCRLRLDNRELHKRLGGIFAAAPLTGSVGVVTANMARLGYMSESEEEFQHRLERLMEVASISLEIKRKTIELFSQQGLYPFSKYYLDSVYQQTGCYWSNHFSTIGLIGMNEASQNLLGVDISQSGRQGPGDSHAGIHAESHHALSGRNGQPVQSGSHAGRGRIIPAGQGRSGPVPRNHHFGNGRYTLLHQFDATAPSGIATISSRPWNTRTTCRASILAEPCITYSLANNWMTGVRPENSYAWCPRISACPTSL